MVDGDLLVRSNSVLASRELGTVAVERLITLIEGLTLDTRDEVLIEGLFASDADAGIVKQYVPSRYREDPWAKSQFVSFLAEKAPNTVPPPGFEKHIILQGPIRICWRAATILRVLGEGRSQQFFDELKRAHDPAFERKQIFE
jgi:hypothetical protein